MARDHGRDHLRVHLHVHFHVHAHYFLRAHDHHPYVKHDYFHDVFFNDFYATVCYFIQ